MNSLLFRLCLLALVLTSPTKTLAEVLKTSFYSHGSNIALEIDKQYLAVKPNRPLKMAASLNAQEQRHFKQMGVTVVANQGTRSQNDAVGYPVWFNRKTNAVGILTNEIVVKIKDKRGVAAIRAIDGFVAHEQSSYDSRLYIATYATPTIALLAANQLYSLPYTIFSHPNFMIPKDFRNNNTSPEPYYSSQWHLENTGQTDGEAGADVKINGAWNMTKGDQSIVVAVLDAGFQTEHPDMVGAWTTNSGEIPGNNKDDDQNGYIDDVRGWSFFNKSPDANEGSYSEHGVSVAGLTAGRENGAGIIGTCPECSVLPVVVSWNVEDDAEAFHYANNLGADIITNSWGYPVGTPRTDVIEDAIRHVAATGRGGKGSIILFAMNNIDQDDCKGDSPDISSLESVIAVSGSSDQDKKVRSTAWGDCMEFLSPTYESGRAHITTTDLMGSKGYNNDRSKTDLPNKDYTNSFGGTSAATPISAGIFGLMLSVNPDLTRDEALSIVLSTADKIDPANANYGRTTGFSQKYGYGRINGEKAVRAAQVFRKYLNRSKAPTKLKM
jgi:hypothetical protein